ncbi:MAG: TetR/AcrR family transcriptional regulator [Pseudomonadota bacterium]
MEQSTREDTKTALMRSAERLFAEKGLGTVSVKDITKAAGARNPSAVHYHFGNVEELIKEVFAHRFHRIESDRTERLLAVDIEDPKRRLVPLMEAALAPFLETCLEEDGRMYVRFCVQFASDPRFDVQQMVDEYSVHSLEILQTKLVGCLQGLPRAVLAARLRQGFNISLIQAADFSRQLEAGKTPRLEKVVREAALSLSGYFAAPAS